MGIETLPRCAVFCLLAVASLAPHKGLATGWPDVLVPADAQAQWVSSDMLYNGLEMRILRFDVDMTKNEVIAFYNKARKEKLVQNKIGPKTVLGYEENGYYVTVELSSTAGKTTGQLGMTKLPSRKPPAAGQGAIKPSLTKVYEDIVYRDVPGNPRSLRMGNQFSPYQNQKFYERALRAKGYVESESSSECTASSQSCISYYQSNTGMAAITTMRMEKETIVMMVQGK